MNKIEFHQLCLTKITTAIEGYRAEIEMMDATCKFYKDYPQLVNNDTLDLRNLIKTRIKSLGDDFLNHEKELIQMGVDPLDNLPFTSEDKAYIDQFMVKVSWRKRMSRNIKKLLGS